MTILSFGLFFSFWNVRPIKLFVFSAILLGILLTLAHPSLIDELNDMRSFYLEGTTKSLAFRKNQLKKLHLSLQKHQKNIAEALYKDLKKSPEEAFGTETGLVLSEITHSIKNLHRWLNPEEVRTNLLNQPSGSKIYRDSLGVVLIIAPWNYPMQLLMIPLVGAIAGGNTVILKPSELAPATASVVEKIIMETFSSQYIKVVQGDGSEVVPLMMKNFRFDHVFYTGSLPVGKAIYKLAAEQIVPVSLELGGKSPAIVERDANLSVAARRIVQGKFMNAGQTCIAPDYVLVHEDIKNEFIEKLKEAILQFYSADPEISGEYGKIINQQRFDILIGYLNFGKIIYGGKYNKESLFIEPTVLEGVNEPRSAVWTEEIFGPILPLFTFKTHEEAKALVERNPNPLAFYLFTSSRKMEERWIAEVSFGGGCINNTAWHFANHYLPFGGVGNSGIGAYHGKSSFDTFTRAKPIMKTPVWFDPSIKYPPFKGRLKLFKWLLR